MSTTHASCVLLAGKGILIRGASGMGKSRLAHMLLLQGPLYGLHSKLVADDRVVLLRQSDGLIARPPEALVGLLEVRGLGIVRFPYAPEAQLDLVLDLLPLADIPRVPSAEELQTCLEGVTLPRGRAATPEQGLEVLLTMIGQAGARLEPGTGLRL